MRYIFRRCGFSPSLYLHVGQLFRMTMRLLVVLMEDSAVPLCIPAVAHVTALIRFPHDGPCGGNAEEMLPRVKSSLDQLAFIPRNFSYFFYLVSTRSIGHPVFSRATNFEKGILHEREREPTRSECRRINYEDRSEQVIN